MNFHPDKQLFQVAGAGDQTTDPRITRPVLYPYTTGTHLIDISPIENQPCFYKIVIVLKANQHLKCWNTVLLGPLVSFKSPNLLIVSIYKSYIF